MRRTTERRPLDEVREGEVPEPVIGDRVRPERVGAEREVIVGRVAVEPDVIEPDLGDPVLGEPVLGEPVAVRGRRAALDLDARRREQLEHERRELELRARVMHAREIPLPTSPEVSEPSGRGVVVEPETRAHFTNRERRARWTTGLSAMVMLGFAFAAAIFSGLSQLGAHQAVSGFSVTGAIATVLGAVAVMGMLGMIAGLVLLARVAREERRGPRRWRSSREGTGRETPPVPWVPRRDPLTSG